MNLRSNFPEAIEKLAEFVHQNGLENSFFLVGGWVRDTILGIHPKDFDIVTEKDVMEVVDCLKTMEGFKVLAEYPNYLVCLCSLDGNQFEITQTRSEAYDRKGRKPVTTKVASIEEDLLRRDFTINCIACRMDGRVIDPLGGLVDLRDGHLRTPLNPFETFLDDPLRILRGIRFSAKLARYSDKSSISPATAQAMMECVGELKRVSIERVKDELDKILLLSSLDSLQCLEEIGVWELYIPELLELSNLVQGKFHSDDALLHSYKVCVLSQESIESKWAGLLHDISKPETQTFEIDPVTGEEKISFLDHDRLGAEKSATILARLKASNKEIEHVSLLIKNHMYGIGIPEWSPKMIRKCYNKIGEYFWDLMDLIASDRCSKAIEYREKTLRVTPEQLEDLLKYAPEGFTSPLDGFEIMQILGISPGEQVKLSKRYLTTLVEEGELEPTDKVKATEFLLNYDFGEVIV